MKRTKGTLTHSSMTCAKTCLRMYQFRYVDGITKQSISTPMDVGTMVQEIEVPQRWYKYVIAELSVGVCLEVPDADITRLPILQADLHKEAKDVWTGEDDGSPVYLQPRIGVYTR